MEWGHTRRLRIDTQSGDIHGVGIHTERGYKTYTKKGHKGSGDIHVEWRHIRGVGTHTELGYIQKGDIQLTRRRDTHGVET